MTWHPRLTRSRRTGRCARPVRARPRGCCRGSPRAGCAASRADPGSAAATPSTSSAPIVKATCASFGPYSGPVDLDRAVSSNQQPRHRDQLHVVVAGGRRRDRHLAGSGANAWNPPRPACRSRARDSIAITRLRGQRVHGEPTDVEAGGRVRQRLTASASDKRSSGTSAMPSSPASCSRRHSSPSERSPRSPRDRRARSR